MIDAVWLFGEEGKCENVGKKMGEKRKNNLKYMVF